jgi:hypothetical protein
MSLPLGVDMSRHLVEWLLRNPIDLPPVDNVGADRAWRVLMGLADHAHENTGAMWASDRTQERETGLERRGVIQPVRQALEVAGWLVDTGKRGAKGVRVYELVIPGYSRPVVSGEGDLATKNETRQPSGVASGVGSGVGSGEGDLAQTELNRTPPLTPQRENRSERKETPGGGGSKSDEVLAGCLERERMTTPNAGPGLVDKWRKEYRPLVSQAIERDPAGQVNDLAQRCYNLRNGLTTSPTSHAPAYEGGAPNCPHCSGNGYGRPYGSDGLPKSVRCVCVGGTYEGETTLADLTPSKPSPTSHADPVKELGRQLRRVV